MTTLDLIASKLYSVSRPGDLVLVDPWYDGVSFFRYYRGAAHWMTIPPLGFSRFHRFDLYKSMMMVVDQTLPIQPAIDQAGEALRGGHRIFMIGGLEFPPAGKLPAVLHAAPVGGRVPWPGGDFQSQWSAMAGYFIQQHATGIALLRVPAPRDINDYENLSLFVAEGWRP